MAYSKMRRSYMKSAFGNVYKARKYYGYKRKSRAKLSRAGVGGAVNTMPASNIQKLEVKTIDGGVSVTTVAGGWDFIKTDSIQSIVQGTGSGQRIGRRIKVVGAVLRLDVTSVQGGGVLPYTIDMIWDTQPNGALPTIGLIYGSGGPGATRVQLPNANFNDRFIFLKRIEQTGHNQSSITNMINRTVSLSRDVNFDGTTGLIGDVEKGNLLLTACSSDPSVTYDGVVRVMFHDM